MKKIEELNFYELFEIPLNASLFEIRQAYRETLSLYSEDSLPTYSLFSDEERGKILQKIEDAFLTLNDGERRAEYDQMLAKTGKIDASDMEEKTEKKAVPIFSTASAIDKEAFLKKIRNKLADKGLENLANEIHSKDSISGSDLKHLRQSFGIELEEIFEVSRINVAMLEAIEGNQLQKLPPIIYLKNFLKIYADIFHLDCKKIMDGYIKNLTAQQKSSS
ncbi:helix-turn-helix domain-containing protein [Thermodesulfobacteriota bacterium]